MMPTRRTFLQVLGQGSLGCGVAACTGTGKDPQADLGSTDPPGHEDLRGDDLSLAADQRGSVGDLRPHSDLRPPDDLRPAGPPDMACGGMPVPAAYMPGLNEAKYYPAQKVFIARDALGYMAIAPRCPHMGCAVVYLPRMDGQAYICPCHGSTFTLDGSLIAGLSILPLDHVALCWQDDTKGVLLLNPRLLISDPSERLP